MKYLLDTHALLWALMQPGRLSERARVVLEDPAHTLLVSSASAWEIATKHRLGRLSGAEAVVHGLEAHMRALRATELPVTVAHALLAGRLPNEHRDPFDRMLAAQALLEGVPLITADTALAAFPVSILW